MGSELSTGSCDVPEKPEVHPLKAEGDLEEQPARKTSSDTGDAMLKVHSDEGSASQMASSCCGTNYFSLPGEETGAEGLQEKSQEDGQPPSLSQSASSDKGQPTGQSCELDIAKNPDEHSSEEAKLDIAKTPDEHSSEKAEDAIPQIPLEASDKPEAEKGVILSTNESQSIDTELEKVVENLRCLAESTVQEKLSEVNTGSLTEKEEDSEKQTTIQSQPDYGSFEMLAEVRPELAASVTAEGQSSRTTALVIKPLEVLSFAAAEPVRAEMAPLPTAEAQAGQSEGCSEADAQTTEGAEDQTASGTPEVADGEATLAQRTLDTPENPLASNEVNRADEKFIDAIQNDDGGYLATEAMSLVKDHPAKATGKEAEPLLDRLAEPSSMVLQGLEEPKEPSLTKEMDEACSDPAAIEMAEAPVTNLDGRPQPGHLSCTSLAPVARETEPVSTADAEAQIQGSPGAWKDSTKDLAPTQKQEAKFSKSFYLCCSACRDGEGEGNADK